ncbi:MAG: glycosyltransferase family 4 protein [Deltaproteobacteria bacterium]|nr:glycosyltransferase family 4 protein [Deltaproteobacteria bacterium]
MSIEGRRAGTGDASPRGLHVVFLVGFAYPHSSAPANRVHAYARGLVERGNRVTVLCVRAVLEPGRPEGRVPPRGSLDGVEYEWTSGQAESARRFFERRLLELSGGAGGVAEIVRRRRAGGVDAVISYAVPAWVDLAVKAVAAAHRIPIVSEKNEFPFPERGLLSNRLLARLEEAVTWLCYDGIIVISGELQSYFGRVAGRSTRFLRIPILVDFSRFSPVDRDRSAEVRVVYCGDPYGRKDGVPILLEAFGRVAPQFPMARLWVVGDSYVPGVLDGLRKTAEELGIGERVVFTGRVSGTEVPRLLGEADILALARPTSLQAKGGFPTKLGEYLATGNPVVATRVGELGDWLEDGKEVFFCEPDSAESFARRLRDVLLLPDKGREVGQRGRDKALQCFDYRVHAGPLEAFIRSLRNGRGA